MRSLSAEGLFFSIALGLNAIPLFAQQELYGSQSQQQGQQCVQYPGGPPCLPAVPTASDYMRGGGVPTGKGMGAPSGTGIGMPSGASSGVPTLRSPQTLPQQTAPHATQGTPVYTLPQTPPLPLLPGVTSPPLQNAIQPSAGQQPSLSPQQGDGRIPGMGQQPALMQQPGLVPQPPSLVPQPGFVSPQTGLIPYSVLAAEGQRNEFQEFIAQSVGRYLPLFGHNLFTSVPSTFAPVDNVPVTPDYVVGPGDEIMVRAWGQVDIDYRTVVDRNGVINLPRVGNINVSGIRYQDLNGYLRTAIGRVFRNFELSVTLGLLRSIQVFVVGQAKQPGSYTVSSLSTLVNALFAAGGPSAKGSMRRIQLKRGEKTVTELDLYNLLLTGDKSKDVPLLPGDVIYIPPVGDLAAISGSVNEPAVYELKGNTTLNDLIQLSGGLATAADARRVTVERIEEHKLRRVDEFALDAAGLERQLKDGDLVRVYALSPKFENAVTLRGAVARPGRYPWREGMRIRDIIPDKDALIVPDYWQRQVRAPEILVFGQQRLRMEIRRSYDEINWDYAVIERLSYDDLTSHLISFNLWRAIVDGDQTNNVLLRPGDLVTIFSKADIQVPIAEQTKFARLEGEIPAPGVYYVMPGETLRQLVVRVGGLTANAYLYASEFTRESTREFQQKRLNESIEFLEREIQRNLATSGTSASTREDIENAKLQAEAQKQLVERLRQFKASGRIVLELTPERARIEDLPDLVLEDGDRFLVPPQSSTVSVIGSVYNQNAFIYRPGGRVSDYLARAGGPTRDADKGSIFVVRADGSVISQRQSRALFFGLGGGFQDERLMPGATIIVPEEFEKFHFTKELKDWTQILYQSVLGVVGIAVLKNNI